MWPLASYNRVDSCDDLNSDKFSKSHARRIDRECD